MAAEIKTPIVAPSRWLDTTAVLVWILPMVYLLMLYPSLPDTVPMHFNASGVADGFGKKSSHMMIMCGLWVFNILIYLLVRNVPKLDPKSRVGNGVRIYANIALAVLVMMSVLHVIIDHATAHGALLLDRMILALMGGFFAYLGYVMKDIPPNYFVGIRTPWTLEDPENWKATHRLGSRWFLWGGLAVVVVALVLERPYELFISMALILLIAIIPVISSYRYFRAHQSKA
jgi:uncharacterized membrane protein